MFGKKIVVPKVYFQRKEPQNLEEDYLRLSRRKTPQSL